MKLRTSLVGAAALILAATAFVTPPARAGVDISFGANVPVGDDGNLFFSISSRYFDRDPVVINTWARRYPNPDDLAVSLFIAQRSGKAPDFIFSLRQRGLSWYDVGTRCGVPVDAWYVPVASERPGPPYGNAYGYWKHHQRDPHYVVRLSDIDARNLVAVRMVHEYYGVSPEVAMEWRRGGDNLRTIMSREYRNRHGKHGPEGARGHDRDDRHDDDNGHGHGHGNGHGHGHDHD